MVKCVMIRASSKIERKERKEEKNALGNWEHRKKKKKTVAQNDERQRQLAIDNYSQLSPSSVILLSSRHHSPLYPLANLPLFVFVVLFHENEQARDFFSCFLPPTNFSPPPPINDFALFTFISSTLCLPAI